MNPNLYYFDEHEFVRNGVAWFPLMDSRILILVDLLRHLVQRPFLISESKHALGRRAGDSQSWHNIDQHGVVYAMDGYFDGIDSIEKATDVVGLATDIGITGIGVYRDWRSAPFGFHFDSKTNRAPRIPCKVGARFVRLRLPRYRAGGSRMKRLALIIGLALFLIGCGSFSQLREQGANVADQGLEGGVWTICYAASIGSIRRRFGTSADRAAAYELFCEAEWNLETVKVPLGGSNATVQ